MNNNYQNQLDSLADDCDIDQLLEYLENDLSPAEVQSPTNQLQGPSTGEFQSLEKEYPYQENVVLDWPNYHDPSSDIQPSDGILVESRSTNQQQLSRSTKPQKNRTFYKDKKAYENRRHHTRLKKAFLELNGEIDKVEGHCVRTKLQTLQAGVRVLQTSE